MVDESAPVTVDGPLSVDQAIESLLAPAPEQDDNANGWGEKLNERLSADTESEAEPTAEEPTEEAENPEDGETAEDPAEPVVALEAPKYWATEAKAKFAALPPELQAVVLEQEGPREEAAAKAKQEAAKERQGAAHTVSQVQQIVAGLNDIVPKAMATFASRWDGIDWTATAEQHGADQTMKWRMEMEAEQAQITKLQAEQSKAADVAHQAFVQAEAAKLAGTDLEKPEVRNEVGKYLIDGGIEPAALRGISAFEMTVAHKAMLWDRAQAALKARPAPKPAAPVKAAVRPAATPAQSPTQRTALSAQNAFNARPTAENAMALLLSKASN